MTEIEERKPEIGRLKAGNEIQQCMAYYETIHLNPACIARNFARFANWWNAISAGGGGWVRGQLAVSEGKIAWYMEIVTVSRKHVFRLNLDRDKNAFDKWAESLRLLLV